MIVGLIVLLVLAFAFGVGGYTFFAACSRKDMDWLDEAQARKTPFGKFYPAIQMGHQWLLDIMSRIFLPPAMMDCGSMPAGCLRKMPGARLSWSTVTKAVC